MSIKFQYADLHCHPNLKTYGHSFRNRKSEKRQNVWFHNPPNFLTKLLNKFIGVTRLSQSDFTTMSKGGAKIIFVSLYPFEKGFFINSVGKGPLSAWLSHLVTGIGYKRVRNLQQHNDYFQDLDREYNFLLTSKKNHIIDGQEFRWNLIRNKNDFESSLVADNEISVFLSIEGAHVFNSGLSRYGRPTSETEIIDNIKKVKHWEYPPFFITFAHNFNNDFCGHAHSLEPLRNLVDQTERMNKGFTRLGEKVLHELLSSENGRPIYIDIKHMSFNSRIEYFDILAKDYVGKMPPTIVSHGAVNGLSLNNASKEKSSNIFYPSDINFFDEELEQIGKYGGLFAIQFDTRRIAQPYLVKKSMKSLFKKNDTSIAANVIWHQIKHIAEVLDKHGLFGWGTACIGSDYDGTIDPLPGIWSSENFPSLYDGILNNANLYLKNTNPLRLSKNKLISADDVAKRFFVDNTIEFIQRFYN